jgi:hypothetical protein
MIKIFSTSFLAFLQASALVFYLILVACFFTFVPKHFDNPSNQFFAPIIMLLFFILSAVITATVVLGYPAIYFWEKKYKACFTLLGFTVAWGLFYFVLFLLMLSV